MSLLVPVFTVAENVMLGHQTQKPFASGIWIDRDGARKQTEEHGAPLAVAPHQRPGNDQRRPHAGLVGGALGQDLLVGGGHVRVRPQNGGRAAVEVAAEPAGGAGEGAVAAAGELVEKLTPAAREGLANTILAPPITSR